MFCIPYIHHGFWTRHGDDLEDTLKSSLERLGTSFIAAWLQGRGTMVADAHPERWQRYSELKVGKFWWLMAILDQYWHPFLWHLFWFARAQHRGTRTCTSFRAPRVAASFGPGMLCSNYARGIGSCVNDPAPWLG